MAAIGHLEFLYKILFEHLAASRTWLSCVKNHIKFDANILFPDEDMTDKPYL